MIAIQIRFLSGRFHANPWQKAHNEGAPEWPPAPWRILRALVNAAFSEGIDVDRVEPLLEKLRAPPRYRVPPARDAHTRHYMPDSSDANHKRTKVFDAFVAIDGGAKDPRAVLIGWPGSLSLEEQTLLRRLCSRIGYIGRAESWAEVTVSHTEAEDWNCWPDEQNKGAAATSLLALTSPTEFEAWSNAQEKPKKGRDVPRRLWDILTFDGERYRAEGWTAVPGTRLIRYVFAEPPFQSARVATAARPVPSRPTIARFVIRSAVLPRLQDALLICDRLRRGVMSQSEKVRGDASAVFSGHGMEASNHQHAMYFSTCENAENRARDAIDHLIISARAGFDEEDIVALQRLRRLFGREDHMLELILTGVGRPSDFGGAPSPRTPILSESRRWRSVTPFIPTRHPKIVRGAHVDTIEAQLSRACEQLLGVRPISITPYGNTARWSRFRRKRRSGGGHRGLDRAFGATLTFADPVRGPIALGYGAHFGLGLFSAVDDED